MTSEGQNHRLILDLTVNTVCMNSVAWLFFTSGDSGDKIRVHSGVCDIYIFLFIKNTTLYIYIYIFLIVVIY